MTNTYTLPEGLRVYAIGDVHGYPDALRKMQVAIDADLAARPVDDAQIVYLGDYIDRGPDSKGVLDVLIGLELDYSDRRHVFLKGNHENGMLEFMEDPLGRRVDWLEWGGLETLISYGVEIEANRPLTHQTPRLAEDLKRALPGSHLSFLQNLELMHVAGDYVFVHAGIRPGVPLDKQKEQDLTFIRKDFLDYEGKLEKRVVHGHTICKEPEILESRINVDTGLYKGRALSCAVIEGTDVRVIQSNEDAR